MRIVLDTNVLVSALLSPYGPPGRVLDGVSGGWLAVLYDDRLLFEYRDVLARPRLRIPPEAADDVLGLVEGRGERVTAPPLAVAPPDPDDLAFLEVAVAGDADALVTGNGRDFPPADGEHAISILPPRQFLDVWRQYNG